MLNNQQKQTLRSLGNRLNASVQIGKEGLSNNVIDMAERSIVAHDLIKVSVLKTCQSPIRELALDLASQTNSDLVFIIGRTFLLYRKGKQNLLDHE